MQQKSTLEEIRQRFDQDVERFSNIETGQLSTIDATISLELITESARRIRPDATQLLDIGCGAGNYTVKMLQKLPGLHCSLVDLSLPMLNRAGERTLAAGAASIQLLQGDFLEMHFEKEQFDIILAAAVLHHLRTDADWKKAFRLFYQILKPGGCLLISDLIVQETAAITAYTWERYGQYLTSVGGEEYRDKVLAYIDKEDTPRSMTWQLDCMQQAGFSKLEILHKNMCFGAFGAVK